jgi:4-hydroxybenzoate polyprenyltransferase
VTDHPAEDGARGAADATPTAPLVVRLLQFVRFSHTIFALPFALGAMLVAADGWPAAKTCGLIVLAMVFARTAAMAFNRVADWQIDQRNPRTAGRHKLVGRGAAIVLVLGSAAAFVGVTWFINPLCLALSPVALGIIFFYSLTKRFTAFSHFFLGLALSVAPVGAWLAVRGTWDLAPLVLALAVLLWVAGFDIIYATQDHEFDRAEGLRSLVVKLGVARSLQWAQRLHWMMLVILGGFGIVAQLGPAYYGALAAIGVAIVYEHRSAARLDVAAINRAFFASNAFVGVVFVAGILVDRLLTR